MNPHRDDRPHWDAWRRPVRDPGPPLWLGLGVAAALGLLVWAIGGTLVRWVMGAP